MFITLMVIALLTQAYETALVLINSIVSKHPGFSSERFTFCNLNANYMTLSC